MGKITQVWIAVMAVLALGSCGSGKKAAYSDAELEAFKTFLENKEFVFKARWANPLASQGLNAIANAGLLAPGSTAGRIDLFNSNNTLEINGDTITANLPYYGERRFAGGYNTNNTGIKFNDTPEDYTIAYDEKRNAYTMAFVINNGTENYNVTGTFFPNLSANVFINSTQRQGIGFTGKLETIAER